MSKHRKKNKPGRTPEQRAASRELRRERTAETNARRAEAEAARAAEEALKPPQIVNPYCPKTGTVLRNFPVSPLTTADVLRDITLVGCSECGGTHTISNPPLRII